MIHTNHLSMCYKVRKKESGFIKTAASLFKNDYQHIKALEHIDISITEGEVVGFIGPNGAGKTTLLKILSGLMHPTEGEVRIAGYIPYERKKEFKRMISLVLGQKSQLMWDIPAIETFQLNKAIYRVGEREFKLALDELIDTFDVGHRLQTPVRQLSLGERMKMELIASLIHKPKLLFLDEPTIGLDFQSQIAIRNFLKNYIKKQQTTIIITSHNMEDITSICERLLVINKGKLIFNGPISAIHSYGNDRKYITLKTSEATIDKVRKHLLGVTIENDQYKLTVEAAKLNLVIGELLQCGGIQDLTVGNQPIEELILFLLSDKRGVHA